MNKFILSVGGFPKMIYPKVMQQIFSVQNADRHKIITVLGLKLKLKSKKLIERKRLKLQKEFEDTVLNFDNKILILYFDHGMGGGTETYFYNQIRNLPKDYLIIRVQYFYYKNFYKISAYDGYEEISARCRNLETLFGILDKMPFKIIVLNNIVSYPNVREILDYTANRNCFITLKLHDFYSVCPSWTLLNFENKYCNVETSPDICKNCYKKFKFTCKDIKKDFSILKWRNMWGEYIENEVDKVEIFSPSSCKIFLKVYPFAKEKIKLVPHKIKPFPKYNVAILGSLGINKGAKIIKALMKYLLFNNINDYHFILFGANPKNIKSEFLTVFGEYKRDNLINILKANNIDAIFIPSVCPETFSYTTAEAIASGYPVMCFGIGGQADQVSQYTKGKILTSFESQIIEKEMKYFLENMKGEIYENYTKIPQ